MTWARNIAPAFIPTTRRSARRRWPRWRPISVRSTRRGADISPPRRSTPPNFITPRNIISSILRRIRTAIAAWAALASRVRALLRDWRDVHTAGVVARVTGTMSVGRQLVCFYPVLNESVVPALVLIDVAALAAGCRRWKAHE